MAPPVAFSLAVFGLAAISPTKTLIGEAALI
jgi:hypothetical protein